MANDFSINLNGEKFTLREGMKINELKKQEQKALFSIFDFDCNGELSEEDFEYATYEHGLSNDTIGPIDTIGTITIGEKCMNSIIENNKTKITLDWDIDEDGNKDITETWTVDNENNRLIEKTENYYGRESYDTYKYNNETGKISQIKSEFYSYSEGVIDSTTLIREFDGLSRDHIGYVQEDFENGIIVKKSIENNNKATDIEYENGEPVTAEEFIEIDEEEFLRRTIDYKNKNEDGKPKITYTHVPEGWSLEQARDAFGD